MAKKNVVSTSSDNFAQPDVLGISHFIFEICSFLRPFFLNISALLGAKSLCANRHKSNFCLPRAAKTSQRQANRKILIFQHREKLWRRQSPQCILKIHSQRNLSILSRQMQANPRELSGQISLKMIILCHRDCTQPICDAHLRREMQGIVESASQRLQAGLTKLAPGMIILY